MIFLKNLDFFPEPIDIPNYNNLSKSIECYCNNSKENRIATKSINAIKVLVGANF